MGVPRVPSSIFNGTVPYWSSSYRDTPNRHKSGRRLVGAQAPGGHFLYQLPGICHATRGQIALKTAAEVTLVAWRNGGSAVAEWSGDGQNGQKKRTRYPGTTLFWSPKWTKREQDGNLSTGLFGIDPSPNVFVMIVYVLKPIKCKWLFTNTVDSVEICYV